MEGDHRRSIHTVGGVKRVRFTLPHSPTNVARASLFPSKGRSYITSTCGSRCLTGKEGSRKGGRSPVSWLLQPPFSCPQEKWQNETSDRPVVSEQVHRTGSLQDGNAEVGYRYGAQPLLDSFHRPAGCLPPRSYTSSVQEISEVCHQRESVPVPYSPFRDLYGTDAVHETDEVRGRLHQETRSQSTPVSGRLADLPHFSGSGTEPPDSSLGNNYPAGPITKPREVRTGPEPEVCVYRDALPHRPRHCANSPGQSGQHSFSSVLMHGELSPVRQDVSLLAGKAQCGSGIRGAGQTSSAPAAVHSVLPVEATCTTAAPRGLSGPDRVQPPFAMVARTWEADTGRALAPTDSRTPPLHGREPLRVGSTRGTPGLHVPRSVATPSRPVTYQCTGTESCISGNTFPDAPSKGQMRHGSIRQLDCRGLHSQTGRYTLLVPVCGDLGVVAPLPEKRHIDQGSPHSRSIERHSGQPLTWLHDPHRVGDQPADHRQVVPAMGHTESRSVRDEVQSQAPPVRVPSPRPGGSSGGRLGDGVGQSICLRISSDQVDSPGSTTGQEVSRTTHSGGPSVASDVVVQRPVGTLDRRSKNDSVHSKTLNSEQAVPQQPGHAPPSRLEIVRESIRKGKFSSKVARYVSSARRDSTNEVYQADGNVSQIGVVQGKLIHSIHLFPT